MLTGEGGGARSTSRSRRDTGIEPLSALAAQLGYKPQTALEKLLKEIQH